MTVVTYRITPEFDESWVSFNGPKPSYEIVTEELRSYPTLRRRPFMLFRTQAQAECVLAYIHQRWASGKVFAALRNELYHLPSDVQEVSPQWIELRKLSDKQHTEDRRAYSELIRKVESVDWEHMNHEMNWLLATLRAHMGGLFDVQ